MIDIRSKMFKKFMNRRAETSVQDIVDFWKKRQAEAGSEEEKRSWEISPSAIVKWMIEELEVPVEKANQMMKEYSKNLASRSREILTQNRKDEAEKLRQITERTQREIQNPTTDNLPQLPGMEKGSSYKNRISIIAKTRSLRKKYSTQDPRTSSFSDKIDIILDYIENFPSAKAAAQALLDEAGKLLKMLSDDDTQPPMAMATASMAKQALSVSGVVSKVTSFLWLLTALALYGAAGTSDYVSKFGTGDGASEAKAALIFLTSLGASILSSVFLKYIMDRKKQPVQQKRLYEGFNK